MSIAERQAAIDLLNAQGVRVMHIDEGYVIGVWSDLDGPEIRAALEALEMHTLPLRYLDGPGIEAKYKVRVVEGEPVPPAVRTAMEAAAQPWLVRELLLGGNWHFTAPENNAGALPGSLGVVITGKTPPGFYVDNGVGPAPVDHRKPRAIDPETGIRPISAWGSECGRGIKEDKPHAAPIERETAVEDESIAEGYGDLEWKTAKSGSLYARTRDKYVMIVYQRERKGKPYWGWLVKVDGQEEPADGASNCNNEAEAKRSAWEALEGLRNELPFDAI